MAGEVPARWATELEAARAEAAATWPGIEISLDAFARYVEARAAEGDDVRIDGLHLGDLYLACGCALGDRAAIEAFDRAFLQPLRPMLARRGVSEAIADDAVQALRGRLLVAAAGERPRINEYLGKGSLAGWLRVAALRTTRNLWHAEARAGRPHDPLTRPAAIVDPELQVVKERYGAVFQQALEDAIGSLEGGDRLVLRLHFVDGLNLDRLAVVLGISRATAGRRVLSIRRQVRDEVLRLLGERLTATPSEVESLLHVVRSKIDVSFGALVSSA